MSPENQVVDMYGVHYCGLGPFGVEDTDAFLSIGSRPPPIKILEMIEWPELAYSAQRYVRSYVIVKGQRFTAERLPLPGRVFTNNSTLSDDGNTLKVYHGPGKTGTSFEVHFDPLVDVIRPDTLSVTPSYDAV